MVGTLTSIPAGGAGLGGLAFHLAQFHAASLFPRSRGLGSGAFVGGFGGSGIIFFLLKARMKVLQRCCTQRRPRWLQCTLSSAAPILCIKMSSTLRLQIGNDYFCCGSALPFT